MTNTAANVRVAVTGAVANAPLATALPTDADTPLAVTYKDLGYVHEDGITQSMSTDVTDIKAWQNGDVVRKVQTSHDLTYQFTLLETSPEVLKAYYADPTASATGAKITGAQTERGVWILEVQDGDQLIRVVLPDAQITERGDVSYKGDEAIGYDVTITAYPDDTGVKAYLYLDAVV